MELAVISDVHGNRPALEAVIDDVPDSVDEIVCLGDTVGYGPWPAACVETVRERCSLVLQGNHDREVRDPEGYTNNRQAMAGLRYAREALPDAALEWLGSLPRRQRYRGELLAVHDHPETVDAYVMPRQFPQMRPYLDDLSACFLGHTHVQHEAVIDGRLVLNPGSVGQPRDGDPRAAYAVVETDGWEADLRRVEYDVSAVERAVADTDLPSEVADRLREGR